MALLDSVGVGSAHLVRRTKQSQPRNSLLQFCILLFCRSNMLAYVGTSGNAVRSSRPMSSLASNAMSANSAGNNSGVSTPPDSPQQVRPIRASASNFTSRLKSEMVLFLCFDRRSRQRRRRRRARRMPVRQRRRPSTRRRRRRSRRCRRPLRTLLHRFCS